MAEDRKNKGEKRETGSTRPSHANDSALEKSIKNDSGVGATRTTDWVKPEKPKK